MLGLPVYITFAYLPLRAASKEQIVWAAVKCFWKANTSILFETRFIGKGWMNPENGQISPCYFFICDNYAIWNLMINVQILKSFERSPSLLCFLSAGQVWPPGTRQWGWRVGLETTLLNLDIGKLPCEPLSFVNTVDKELTTTSDGHVGTSWPFCTWH